MPHPGEPDDKYYKFLSGIGMQEPKEKFTAKARGCGYRRERVFSVQSTIEWSCHAKGSPSKGTLRQYGGNQDKPHYIPRSTSSKSLKI